MNIFPYVPKVPTYQIANIRDGGFVTVAIDIIDQFNVKSFGLVEILTPTAGAFIGDKAIWTMGTQNAVIGDAGEVDNLLITHIGEVKWQVAGTALTIINQEGSKLVTDFDGELQAVIDADPRFHAAGTVAPPVVSGGPPFTDENLALAWLPAQAKLLKIVNGKVVPA